MKKPHQHLPLLLVASSMAPEQVRQPNMNPPPGRLWSLLLFCASAGLCEFG